MIISASYKTDIPAFYSRWFLNRLRAGFCKMVNPFNSQQHRTVSLLRRDVDGFVFWTKNPGPFLDVLPEVKDLGFPFVVQFTINGYPRALESRVIDAKRSIEQLRLIREKYGLRVPVWRYDPIIISTVTPPDFHRDNFSALAKQLRGNTDEVVVSFVQVYKKTGRNLDNAAVENAFSWRDPSQQEKQRLLRDLIEIAAANRLRLKICTQPELVIAGAVEARCVDGERLMDIAQHKFRTQLKGMRPGCGCFESIDIGDYDTCPHGCVYCYAVRDRKLALTRYQAHDPDGEYLFPRPPQEPISARQGNLFERS